MINYKENNKLRIRNFDSSFSKHEVVKLLVMIIARRQDKKAGIYSEHTLDNGDIVDVFVDTIKHKERRYYEIQKKTTNQWHKKIYNRDCLLDITTTTIPLEKLPDDLIELEKEVEKYV